MKILLVAATVHELEKIDNSFVDTVITGIGAAATIYHLQNCIQQNNYDLVIQAGIAGAFNNEINLGETVIVKYDCFGDIGIEEKGKFTPIFNTALGDKNEFPYNNGWLMNSGNFLKSSSLELVKAVTVNKISDSENQKQQLIDCFNPEIETMEGAAFHYVCLQEKIEFIQLRSISNYVGERDKANWKMEEAIKNLNAELKLIIEQLIHT